MKNNSIFRWTNVFIYVLIIGVFTFFLVKILFTKSEYFLFQIMACIAIIGYYIFKMVKEIGWQRNNNQF